MPVVKGMVGLVPVDPDLLWVVLFNLEFLEELIYCRGVDKAKIVFMADNSHEAGVAMGVYGVKTFELPQTVRDPAVVINLLAAKISIAFYQGGTVPKTNNLVVGGNPPYNSARVAGSTSSNNIYHLFVQAVVEALKPKYHTFITPSRWMQGGKGLDKFRAWMLSGAPTKASDGVKHLKEIVDFKGNSDVFVEADIPGGVSYYLWDRDNNHPTCMYSGVPRKLDEFDVFIREKVYLEYAQKFLHPEQIDTVDLSAIPGIALD